MSDDQFTKLFKYIQEFRQEMHREFAKVHTRIDTLHGAIDDTQKQFETDEQERLVINHQLDRHVGWFKQLSKNTKTKLVPGP